MATAIGPFKIAYNVTSREFLLAKHPRLVGIAEQKQPLSDAAL